MTSFPTPIVFGNGPADDNVFEAVLALETRMKAGALTGDDVRAVFDAHNGSVNLAMEPPRANSTPHGYFHNGNSAAVNKGGFEEVLVYRNPTGQMEALVVSNHSVVIADPTRTKALWIDFDPQSRTANPVYLGMNPGEIRFEVYNPSPEASAKVQHVRDEHLTGKCNHNLWQRGGLGKLELKAE